MCIFSARFGRGRMPTFGKRLFGRLSPPLAVRLLRCRPCGTLYLSKMGCRGDKSGNVVRAGRFISQKWDAGATNREMSSVRDALSLKNGMQGRQIGKCRPCGTVSRLKVGCEDDKCRAAGFRVSGCRPARCMPARCMPVGCMPARCMPAGCRLARCGNLG